MAEETVQGSVTSSPEVPGVNVQTTVKTGEGVTTGHGVTSAGGKEWAEGEAARVAADKAAKAGTIVSQPAVDQPVATPADFPADWRAKLNPANDPKVATLLDRLGAPTDLVKSYLELRAERDSGKLKTALPKDATPEQIAQYRKEQGIPETPDKYDLTLADGLVIGEADQLIIKNMLGAMHGMNLNNDQVKQLLGAYYQNEKQFLIEKESRTAVQKTQAEDALHKEWGPEFRPNVNLINGLLDTFPAEAQDVFNNAMGPDGLPLLNNPDALRALTLMARQINPVPTITGGTPGNQAASIDSEIATIEKRISEDRAGYFKDEPMQARYRELLEWRERQKAPKA